MVFTLILVVLSLSKEIQMQKHFDYVVHLPPDNNNRYNQQFPAGIDAYLPPSANQPYGGYIPNINVNIGNQLQGMHNPCQYNPCKNGGTCGQMTINTFVCYCAKQYHGDFCDISVGSNNLILVIVLSTILPFGFIIVILLFIVFFCHRNNGKLSSKLKNKKKHLADAKHQDPESARELNINKISENSRYKEYYDDESHKITTH